MAEGGARHPGRAHLLSLWAVYKLEAQVETFLGDTHLQATIANQITEGNELLRRLRRQHGEQVSKALSEMVLSWGGRTIRDINEVAPELGDELNAKYAYLDTREREGQIRYVKRFLGGLEKVGEELHGFE
jgi:broad specificity phosphatase PhoE